MTITHRPPVIRLYEDEGCIDGFAGGGGTSKGIEMAIGRGPDVAINHDQIALGMHEINHPQTRHIRSNIRTVQYETALPVGQRCGFAWFSPDCTHFSKAKGGRPFRDPQRARRVRGLAWEAVRCAKAIRPRIIFLENVEEWLLWGPLGADGRPDPTKKGASFRRWLRDLRALGYVVEWRQLRACDFGAPTTRKRLFVIARCDGQPVMWPMPTHGPKLDRPYRTAAECIDFSIPVPSIFLTQAQARRWAKAHGVEAPHRPLARATLRRIARGVQRFVIEAAEPFVIPVLHQGDDRVHSVHEPVRTITCAHGGEFAVVTPFLAKYHHPTSEGGERGQSLDEPIRTLDTSNRFALVTPFLAKHCTGSTGSGLHDPMRTVVAAGVTQALVVPTLINTRNGERVGQAPRVLDIQKPLTTVTASGSQGALVAAFLAKHNGGHEATGQRLTRPTDTVVCRENKSLVTSHLVKLYGTCQDGAPTSGPMPTVTSQGNHLAEVRAFLVKYYGSKKDGRPLSAPCDTITTKDRFALATVAIDGETYAIVDIGMRMLTPRELFNAQGFPHSYAIDSVMIETPLGLMVERRLTKRDKTRLCGNSVPPPLAAALIAANLERPAVA